MLPQEQEQLNWCSISTMNSGNSSSDCPKLAPPSRSPRCGWATLDFRLDLRPEFSGSLRDRPQQVTSDGLVMSGPDGLVQWINPAFSAMCGYTLEELRGKKLGPILQGEKTDRKTAERLRRAVHEYRPCREAILNYRKNGEPYWVEISMTPILDGVGQPLWLVARERKLADRIAA